MVAGPQRVVVQGSSVDQQQQQNTVAQRKLVGQNREVTTLSGLDTRSMMLIYAVPNEHPRCSRLRLARPVAATRRSLLCLHLLHAP